MAVAPFDMPAALAQTVVDQPKFCALALHFQQKPNQSNLLIATGAALRKAGYIKNSPWLEGQDIRFIIDDRTEPEKAETERQIMGSLVKAMMFSRLQIIGAMPVKH